MTSPKLPLVGGIISPLHNSAPAAVPPVAGPIPNILVAPTDKALQPVGVQDIFELHLWLIPGGDPTDQRYYLSAYEDNNPAGFRIIWSGNTIDMGLTRYNPPIKILDGYPIRGNVTIAITADFNTGAPGSLGDEYPQGAQVFGYAYRVGQGTQNQPERRFIGEPSSDGGLSVGLPLEIPPETKSRVHTFQSSKIDEVSLAFARRTVAAGDPDIGGWIAIVFEDANDAPLIPNHRVLIDIEAPDPNYLRDPQSVYTIYQAVFGNIVYANLDHISVEPNENPPKPLYVHGYFNRR